MVCVFAYNKEIPIFHNILKLVFQEIVKHEEYLMVKLIMGMEDRTNMKMKSNMKAKIKILKHKLPK